MIKISANIGIVVCVSLATLLGACSFVDVHGADTPDQVVKQYVSGLERQEEDLILQLIPKGYTAEQAVKDKISQFGGYEIEEYNVVYNELKPVFLIANIEGRYAANNIGLEKFEDTVTIAYRGAGTLLSKKTRWYLLLGDGNVPSPNIAPGEPQGISPE
ncbi:MAG: hypothetical protein F6K47_35485 [Symploca sp. SIO2E6]|nr:hypothetical protein [Symploca sp. SIO2E6]